MQSTFEWFKIQKKRLSQNYWRGSNIYLKNRKMNKTAFRLKWIDKIQDNPLVNLQEKSGLRLLRLKYELKNLSSNTEP